jgi:hypothetical protein
VPWINLLAGHTASFGSCTGALCACGSAFMLFLAAFFDGFKPPPGWHPVLPETVLIAVPFTGRCIRLLATHFGSDYRMSRLDVSNHSGCEYDQLPVNKQTFWFFSEITPLFLRPWMFWLITVVANVSLTVIPAIARLRPHDPFPRKGLSSFDFGMRPPYHSAKSARVVFRPCTHKLGSMARRSS